MAATDEEVATRLLALSGSLRSDSYNTKLLAAAADLLPDDVTLELWNELETVPPYNADIDDEPAPEPVARLRTALAAADGVLIATPEYNSSVPGQLKNAFDWASRPFPDNALRGKPVAVIGASTGSYGAVRSQAETRKTLNAIGASVIDDELPVGRAQSAFDETGSLREEERNERLRSIVGELVSRAKQHSVEKGEAKKPLVGADRLD